MKRITVMLLMLLFLSYTGCNFFSGDSFGNGFYRNEEIGFFMEFPQNWHKVSRPDFIQSLAFTDVKHRLFVSPTKAEEALMVVSTRKKLTGPIQLDELWNLIVRTYKSAGLKIKLNTEEDVNGIEVSRLGGTIKYYIAGQNADYYDETVLFALENRLVVIDIYLREPVDEATLSEVNDIVRSIQKID